MGRKAASDDDDARGHKDQEEEGEPSSEESSTPTKAVKQRRRRHGPSGKHHGHGYHGWFHDAGLLNLYEQPGFGYHPLGASLGAFPPPGTLLQHDSAAALQHLQLAQQQAHHPLACSWPPHPSAPAIHLASRPHFAAPGFADRSLEGLASGADGGYTLLVPTDGPAGPATLPPQPPPPPHQPQPSHAPLAPSPPPLSYQAATAHHAPPAEVPPPGREDQRSQHSTHTFLPQPPAAPHAPPPQQQTGTAQRAEQAALPSLIPLPVRLVSGAHLAGPSHHHATTATVAAFSTHHAAQAPAPWSPGPIASSSIHPHPAALSATAPPRAATQHAFAGPIHLPPPALTQQQQTYLAPPPHHHHVGAAAAGGGVELLYDHTTGLVLEASGAHAHVLQELVAQGHALEPAASACAHRALELQSLINGELLQQRARIVNQQARLSVRAGEVRAAAARVAQHTRSAAQEMLDRLADAESTKLSELAGQQARLAADLAAMEDVIRGAVQLCQGPPHEQQQQQAPDAFLAESARLLHEARLAATKVVPDQVGVSAEDLPAELQALLEAQHARGTLARLLRVKDAMIWQLLRDRDALSEEAGRLAASFGAELEALDRQCQELQDQLSASQQQQQQSLQRGPGQGGERAHEPSSRPASAGHPDAAHQLRT